MTKKYPRSSEPPIRLPVATHKSEQLIGSTCPFIKQEQLPHSGLQRNKSAPHGANPVVHIPAVASQILVEPLIIRPARALAMSKREEKNSVNADESSASGKRQKRLTPTTRSGIWGT